MNNTSRMIERISILGTGLIGGSIALAWQEHRPDLTLVGHDRPEVLAAADERGAIDEKAADPVTAVADSDLVVLATPVGTVLRLLDQVADALPDGAIVTDVASVKQPVLDQARDVLPDAVSFLGGHPMTGAESSGIAHADPLLFENALYALSLPEAAGDDALDTTFADFVALIESIGARPLRIDAATHDRLGAVVSHLPQVLATALVTTMAETEDPDDLLFELAAGGFRDMTRIASSPFDMWRDIFVGNEGPLLDAISHFTRSLQKFRNRMLAEDFEGMEDMFETAQSTRSNIPRNQKGFLQPLADIYVRVADEPGILHTLTGHLVDADLNIKDVELQRYREGTGGTFRLSFDSDEDAEAAAAVLSDAGYTARRPD